VQKDLFSWVCGERARTGLNFIETFFAFALIFPSLRAEDLTTTSGQTYHEVQVLSRDSSAMIIQSREGSFKLALSEVKPADRERYSKDLTKAIDLPAITVIGEERVDFNAVPEQSRTQTLVEKEMQRQTEEREGAARKRTEAVHPLQITSSISFSLGSSDPKSDTATQPSYLSAEYQRLAPDIVEKDLRVFSLSLKNSQ
jgi:hypothetical protein